MKAIYTNATGALAMKVERIAVAQEQGVTVLLFGEKVPTGSIHLSDIRPKGFKGVRGENDPADTAVIIDDVLMFRSADFSKALKKAIKLASGN